MQGIFDGEDVSVHKVRDRLAGENNAAIEGRFALPAQSALVHPCTRAQQPRLAFGELDAAAGFTQTDFLAFDFTRVTGNESFLA